MIILGVIRNTIAKAGKLLQLVADGREGETLEKVAMAQQWGVAARPPAGSNLVIIRDGGIYLGIGSIDPQYLPELEEGDACLYDSRGQFVKLTKEGISIKVVGDLMLADDREQTVELTEEGVAIKATTATMDVAELAVTGSITAGGEVADLHGSMTQIRTVYNGHSHKPDGSAAPQMGV